VVADSSLSPVGKAVVGDRPVKDIAVLRRPGGGSRVIAVDDQGTAVSFEM